MGKPQHQDDVHRRIGQRHQILLSHEFGRLGQRRLGRVHHLVARRLVGIRQFQGRFDRRLLLVVVGRFGQLGRAGRVLEHGARDPVHVATHALELGFGTLFDIGTRQRRQQREFQLLVVFFGTDAEVALGIGHQHGVQPGLLLGHCLAQVVDGRLRTRRLDRAKLADVGGDEAVDDAQDALVLLGHRFGMDLRHARRIQVLACLRKDARDLFHALGGRGQALGQRREFARHQAVQRAAGQAVVDLRVPGPALQHLGVPDLRLQLVAQNDRIHLVLARELGYLDRIQGGQQLLARVHAALTAAGAQVVDLRIEAVVAGLGGGHRRQLHPGVQGLLG